MAVVAVIGWAAYSINSEFATLNTSVAKLQSDNKALWGMHLYELDLIWNRQDDHELKKEMARKYQVWLKEHGFIDTLKKETTPVF